MNLEMKFEESNQHIDLNFGEIQTASDGGFERGYAEGFEKGEEQGYSNGYDTASEEIAPKFGILETKNGSGIVTLDYVNENEHNVEVQLSSDTITDFSGVEVKQLGKNVLPPIGEGWFFGTCSNNRIENFETPSTDFVYAPNQYSFVPAYILKVSGMKSVFVKKPQNVASVTIDGFANYDDVTDSSKRTIYSSRIDTTKPITLDENTNYLVIMYSCYGITTETVVTAEDVFATFDTSDISYEPYEEKTYIANADGTVDGVTSVSPIMNLMCEGVDISAKYYQNPSSEYDRFWDNYQANGSRTNYNYGFGGEGWNDETFKPKYDIKVTMSAYMFHSSKITNLKAILEECGVVLDFSNCTTFTYPFNNSTITDIGVIDCRAYATLNYLFYSARCVKNVEKVIVNERNAYSTTGFFDMVALEEIRFEGVIGSSFNIQWSSKMSVESAKSILLCLKNYKGTDKDMANSITFHANVWALLDAEGNTSPNGNKWKDYVRDMGWSYV